MAAREVTFAEVEFYGGPWDGRIETLRLPLAQVRYFPKAGRDAEVRAFLREPGRVLSLSAVDAYRLRPGPRGLRYELERER